MTAPVTVVQFSEQFIDTTVTPMVPIAGVPVTVKNVDTSAAPLFTDVTGATPLGTSTVNTDSTGTITVFLPPAGSDGSQRYVFTPAGFAPRTLSVTPRDSALLHLGVAQTINADWTFSPGKTIVHVDTTLATDETTNINGVLSGLTARGGHVEIMGPCRITGPLTPTQHGTVIKGYGTYGSALVMDSPTADFIHADGLAEFGVENLQFEAKAGVTRTAGSAIHGTGLIDYHLDNLRFQDVFNYANLIDCGTGFLERLRGVDSGLGATNRGVLLLGCVSTHMYNWIFNWGAAALLQFNAGLRIDSACDTPHGVNLIMQGSSGSGTGLYLASSQTVASTLKTGTVNITAGSRVVTVVSGFTLTAPAANSHGDMGREITVTGLPVPTRIGRVIDSTHFVATQAATATTAGAAATIAAIGPNAFAPRWVEMTNLAVEGSHPPVFGTNSPAGSAPGVVIDDVSTFHWTSGQSASGLTGMVVNKGKDIVVTSVRFINNEKHGWDITQNIGIVVDASSVNCRFSDNSQGQYAGVSQDGVYSGVHVTNGVQYKSTQDYFGDYLVGSTRLQKYGIDNDAGSKVFLSNPQWGNLRTDTVHNKGTLLFDNYGITGLGVARAAAITSPTAPSAGYVQAEAQAMKTAVDALRVVLQNAGISL